VAGVGAQVVEAISRACSQPYSHRDIAKHRRVLHARVSSREGHRQEQKRHWRQRHHGCRCPRLGAVSRILAGKRVRARVCLVMGSPRGICVECEKSPCRICFRASLSLCRYGQPAPSSHPISRSHHRGRSRNCKHEGRLSRKLVVLSLHGPVLFW
jgi:hypothetical protein